MKRHAWGDWVLAAICSISLAGYLLFSSGLRYWLSPWAYFRAIYQGLAARPDPLWIQLWNRLFLTAPWDGHQLALLAGLMISSFLVAILAWQSLGRRIGLGLAVALFVPACLIVPQILLACLLWPDGRGRVTYANHVAMLALAAASLLLYSWMRRERMPTGTSRDPDDGIGPWGFAFFVPAAVVMATALLLGIGNNPGYDAGAYHLPLAAGYGVSETITVRHDIPFAYPANGELVMRWFLFPGNDRLASLPDFLAALLIAVVLYQLCRGLRIPREPALIAACTTITFPVFPYLSMIPNPDLIGIASMLVAVALLVGLQRTACVDSRYFGLFGLALGLAVGARLSLLPPFAFLALALVVVMLRSDRSRLQSVGVRFDWFWILRSLGIAGLCAFAGGGFWYVRNALIHGNPLFPVSVLGLPGMALDAISPVVGVMRVKPWLIVVYPWTEIGYTYVYDTGVGAVFTAVVLPGLVWWPVSMMRNWNAEDRQSRFARVLVYSCVLFCLAYFVSRPSVYTRHAAFGLLLSFFLVAEMWRRLRTVLFRAVLFLSFLVMCFALERSLTGAFLYRLAVPERVGAERFGLPAAVDTLPPSRIFNAAAGYLTYGCMGRDYRHEVVTRFSVARPQDVRESGVDYLLIREEQKPQFESGLSLELVATTAAANPGDSLSLYRVLPP